MTETKDDIRGNLATLEMMLRTAGGVVKGKTVKCPFHEDRHPSGHLYEKDGVWRFKCNAASCNFCGDFFDVKARYEGRPVEDVLRESSERRQPERKSAREYPDVAALEAMARGIFASHESTFQYVHPTTKKTQLVILRCRDADGAKHFLQCRPTAIGFELGAPEKPWPIYNRARVAQSDWCFVVEGEKCVHALHEVGFIATTSPGGAANAKSADWSPLAGKTCYLWPDNDESGKIYMREVAEILEKLQPAANLRWIDPEALDLPPKGDACDFIEIWGTGSDGESKAAIDSLIASARGGGASVEVQSLVEDTISGKRSAISWSHELLGRLTQALLPGTVTMICGNPEGGKSLLVIEEMANWHRSGIPVALYELEDDKAFHLLRFLAQRSLESKMTDAQWVKMNPDEARRIIDAYRSDMDSFGKCLFTAPDNIVSLRNLGEWVGKQADAGKRIIAIDPITAAETSNSPWQDDKRFLIEAKTAVRRNGASLILVTHPRTNQKFTPGLASMAGGAAYSRFSHTVLWLHKLEKKKPLKVVRPIGAIVVAEVTRVLKIFKARNASGGGLELAMELDPQSLRFAEQGRVSREEKPELPSA
jgi:KaiC/GvpD/RAD55 family RecA-like ATPase